MRNGSDRIEQILLEDFLINWLGSKWLKTGDGASQNEGVNVVRSFVRVYRLEIHNVSGGQKHKLFTACLQRGICALSI